ncbi:CSRP2 protein, partial [Pseudoatta argentina]
MQDDDLTSTRRDDDREIESKAERGTFYDIWKADDSLTGRSDDGCSENTPRIDNYAETRCRVSDCTFNNKSQRSQSENINEQTVERDEHTRGEWTGNGDVRPTDRIARNKGRNDEDDTMWNKNLSNSSHKNVDSIGRNEYRMRGGCGGCCEAREKVWRSSQGYGCCCGRLVPAPNESCAPSPDRVKTVCVMPSRSCCCRPRVCRKSARCEPSPCTTTIRSCGGGRCCGGCGKPGQICTSSPRIYNSPAHSSCGRSPCASRCPPQPSCSISGCRSFCSEPNNCRRSRSPRCLSTIGNRCCSVNDGAKCGTDGACCRLRLPCECFGGGLDCRRCGRKVYQAEMQIASGVPYHNICFSCFCCRKPLEPLTYQENGGEIYCKLSSINCTECYVRNFGPRGYGYGMGAGVLQTPL